MRDNFIFYRSFYESAKTLRKSQRLDFYEAIFELALNGENKALSGVAQGMFALVQPQIEANNKRYQNGCKPKAKHKQNASKSGANNNDNVNENVNENDKEKELEKESSNSSSSNSLKESSTVILTMMLDTGDEYEITESMLKEWQQLHPKVNVLEEMQKMKAWLYANPNKRKTRRGMKRFINSWLSSSKSYSENRSGNNAEPKVPDWYKNTGETKPDDELLKQVEEMKRGLNRET